jgi:hypothetical protein
VGGGVGVKLVSCTVFHSKKEQKYLCSNQSRRKRESTLHSSCNRAVAVEERREKEERKRWRYHLKHQSYVCVKTI